MASTAPKPIWGMEGLGDGGESESQCPGSTLTIIPGPASLEE